MRLTDENLCGYSDFSSKDKIIKQRENVKKERKTMHSIQDKSPHSKRILSCHFRSYSQLIIDYLKNFGRVERILCVISVLLCRLNMNFVFEH